MKKTSAEKVRLSMFSVRTAVSVFIAVASALYFFSQFAKYALTRMSEFDTVLEKAALWMGMFIILSLFYTGIILIYRKLTVKNPVMRILQATEKIGGGDFTVRLPVKHEKHFKNEYDVISENINSMTGELSGIETLRHDFVSNVSHEFKAPLALIQNSCTILSDETLSAEERKKYTDDISEASKRLAAMVTNILKLNKIENQQIVTKSEKINLTEQLRDEILVFEYLWTEKNIDIDFSAEEDVFIAGDREMMSLLWSNILSNAFKFTPQGGRVTITAIQNEKYTAVSVADTGEGIPDDKLPRIFEKFYQVDSSHVTEGNGLGLALVKSICDAFGYSIHINNNSDGGCCVRISIKR